MLSEILEDLAEGKGLGDFRDVQRVLKDFLLQDLRNSARLFSLGSLKRNLLSVCAPVALRKRKPCQSRVHA